MKRIFYFAFLVLFCFSCNDKNLYLIEGKIVNPIGLENDTEINLYAVNNADTDSLLSTAVIQDNQFSFKGNFIGAAYIELKDNSKVGKRYLALEAGKIRVILDNDWEVSGTPANNDYQAALNSEKSLNDIDNQYHVAKDNGTLTAELEEQLDKQSDEQFEKVKEAYTTFFTNNINHPLGRKIFSTSVWYRRLSADQLENVLKVADDSFKTTELYSESNKRLYNMKTSTPGNDYKDFVSKDLNGNPVALSEYVGKGKFVLLDFWASWCPPCRNEMPNLVKLYEEYKGKNFEIVSYSLDKEEEAWKKGVEYLGMTWIQMSDCAYFDSPIVKLYAIQSIPCMILINPEGKIVARESISDKIMENWKTFIR